MATPVWYDSTDPETVKAWERDLDVEVRFRAPKLDPANGMFGTGEGNLFRVKEELRKGPGDRIRMHFRWQLEPTNRLKVGPQNVEGEELGFESRTFDIYIDELIQGAKTKGRMAQQRVHFNLIEENKSALADYYADQGELGMSVHLGGLSSVTDPAWNWNNAPTAPDVDHIVRVNDRATDEALVEGDKMNIRTINRTLARVKQVRPRMRPGMIGGMRAFVWSFHSNQIMHMRETDSDFFNLHLKAIEGGSINENPIFTGNLGMYQGCIFMEDQWVSPGFHSTTGQPVANTRRSILMGAGALAMGYGREGLPGGYAPNKYLWYTKEFNAGRDTACYASTIAGIAAPHFERPSDLLTVDYGKMVASSWAEDVAGQEPIWAAIV